MTDTLTDTIKALSYVQIGKDYYYKIANSNQLRPFFMSIVSNSNHWMFIASNGGLSAGRKNAQNALFPYYTDDKITESAEITGSKSIFQIQQKGNLQIWEPFSERFEGKYRISRNLYKSIFGNKIVFEEENHDLQLTFRYEWSFSNLYGFVKSSTLINQGSRSLHISLLDGIQNILPYGVDTELQKQASNLVDAYKRSELDRDTGLGIFSLSAIIVDKAEPSEALKANTVWSLGLKHPQYLLSSLQLNAFRKGKTIGQELEIRAEKGAYFVQEDIVLDAEAQKEWMMIANVNQNHSAIAQLLKQIKEKGDLETLIQEDIKQGTKRLIALNASADGLQLSSDRLRDTRHFSNTLFNIMRGGVFDFNYQIEKQDLAKYLANANRVVFENATYKELPDVFTLSKLKEYANQSKDQDYRRLCLEYLPLKFSRRHGDPSRPWNKFSINTLSEIDGSKILDYEGNWRDIFQNWEALAISFPGFAENMVHKFLNATTFDGYNPYRITKDGFDWETIEPDDPWSYIGYWGDHQIIYLLKLLELIHKHYPHKLESYFDQEYFVYANVPYKIKNYEDILKNPKSTILFDHELDRSIRKSKEKYGADAALLKDEKGNIYKVNFIEKILTTVLAKLSNFIPEGGIWMNTQRPEWNDANNALVGNGVSVVTLCYLRRFLIFFKQILSSTNKERIKLSNELIIFYRQVRKTFEQFQALLEGKIDNKSRKQILDDLGKAGSNYRKHIYKQHTFWGEKRTVTIEGLNRFVDLSIMHIEHSIKANKRKDNLYHAYNLMSINKSQTEVSLSYLSEMLEGQVAVLSSRYLSSQQALALLDALKNSKLFREDQYSYLLYPNKNLPGFLDKNNIAKEAVAQSKLLTELLKEGNTQVIEKDVNGAYHFNGDFKNANDLSKTLNNLKETTKYAELVQQDKEQVLKIFERVFNHKAFTGRSGTFFGYEGLGSIYWHMVSKLLLAVQECCLKAIDDEESEEIIGRLLEHYYEINEGIGVHKPPSLYGAFPTDAYSHTPAGRGAQQPGLTGQVKEDILCRFGELGIFVQQGKLYFNPCLLKKSEFLSEAKVFKFIDVHSNQQELSLEKGQLCFTYCQVPVIYTIAEDYRLEINHKNNKKSIVKNNYLDQETSQQIFERSGQILQIVVNIKESDLK